MKQLIPLLGFVLNESKTRPNVDSDEFVAYQLERLAKIDSYANFLKHEISMDLFIPANGTNPIDELEDKEEYHVDLGYIPFPGFKIDELEGKKHITNGHISVYWYDSITLTWKPSRGLYTVEDLTIFKLDFNSKNIFK